ncbi:MAG TPA: SDR family oxidoreductase [Acidobacteriota bacterium]|nr:SDR family oxidoreductase [Acidobacteriota bacterium]
MFEGKPLTGDVAVVTGGGTGLGRSMALRFAELGARVVVTSRALDNLESVVKEISEKGGEAHAIACDVRDYGRVEEVAAEVADRVGPATILVNNAAGNFLAPTETLSANAFNSVVGIVLNGSFHCTSVFGKQMMAAGNGGRILNIVTTYAWMGSAFVVPSACAKAGVLAMTRSLAVEWGRYKIRVNAIAPGPFPTPGAWEKLMPSPEFEAEAKRRNPSSRFGEHIELANLAAYLVSPYSDYINGECVVIDGGEWLMGGEFNHLATLPPEMLAAMASKIRKPKKDG